MVDSAAPTLTKQGDQDPTTGAVTYKVTKPDGGEYPANSNVALNGHNYTVGAGGIITVPNADLPTSSETKVPTATEAGKLPTAGTAVELPAKLVDSAAPTLTVGTQDKFDGHVDITVTGVPDGTKVTLPGVNGEKEVKGGKVTLTNDDLPDKPTKGKGSAQESGKLPTKDTNDIIIPGKITNSKGEPEVQLVLPEFKGGVNGELPDPVQLPKVQLIITKWIDEEGNELKPADAKAPSVLGEANEALEAGEIEGYVFVRTDVNEKGDVVTHIFRKVTPTKPEGNGEQQGGDNKPQSTPEAPTDNTERKPEVVSPDEQPDETENTTTKPKASQNILPNTGMADGIGIFSAAAASILAGLGLIIPVKKEDEEEEETQNN